MRLLLIRHGQTPENVRGSLNTAHPGPGLTELGHLQAGEIPEALRGDPIDAIFASNLLRTSLTAQPLALDRGVDIQVLPGLHEIEAGDLEDRTDHASIRAYLETVFAWGNGNLDATMPGAFNGKDFFERFDRDIEQIASTVDGTAAVFSHGGSIRVWVGGRARNITPQFTAEHELGNTGIVEVTGFPGDWILTSWVGMPVGGLEFADAAAEDPTGETLSEAREESP